MASLTNIEPNKQRSPLSLSILEISLSLLVGILAWLWLHEVIMSAEPWAWHEYGGPDIPYPDWFIHTRQEILKFTWPMSIAMAISTIFLIRGFSGNIRHFSRVGNLILAWPLLHFLPVSVLGIYAIFCLPLGFILALVLAGATFVERRNYGDLIAVPLSFLWMMLVFIYSARLEGLVGD